MLIETKSRWPIRGASNDGAAAAILLMLASVNCEPPHGPQSYLTEISMKTGASILAVCFAFTIGSAFAQDLHSRIARDGGAQTSPRVRSQPGFIILRQDLFDRNNPNNLRSDWPGPPAQPGQF